ncbi:MAG: hypothetical protein Q8Q09_18435 [Deltaproteobacteria bacterium]|nr:hypothetical protein [Deltaproteobacteria bacterium]
MPVAAKIVLALAAGAASLTLALMAVIALVYAFSNEMPSDSVVPTAITGVLFGAASLGLFALAAWLVGSAFRAPR